MTETIEERCFGTCLLWFLFITILIQHFQFCLLLFYFGVINFGSFSAILHLLLYLFRNFDRPIYLHWGAISLWVRNQSPFGRLLCYLGIHRLGHVHILILKEVFHLLIRPCLLLPLLLALFGCFHD